jgi:hypothetical protein
MDTLRKIRTKEQAADFERLCEQGKCYVLKTFVSGEPELTIYSKSGIPQVLVGDRYKFKFISFMQAAGSGDGLWPGHDQTAARG